MTGQEKPVSTSALARRLDKSTRQMFAELEALGWIRRQDDNWQLTAKGEFEGGSYRDSDRFGRYIIWPATVSDHPALVTADAGLVTTRQLAKQLNLSTRVLHWLIRELGWLRESRKGWELTDEGRVAGGRQRENERTGVPFVLWPDSFPEHPVLQRRLNLLGSAGDGSEALITLDGHGATSHATKQIDDWLYLAGLPHAVGRPLPLDDESLPADFYLPQAALYLEYWQPDADPAQLKQMMRKRELYQLHHWPMIELQYDDLARLDDVLGRQLLKFGIEV